ncbi:ABC transporter ATP-binding protein [Paenibacillus barcinonensis]|uniref:ABC transporter ATP-binding protein n=1 Tax=Paenibacillus barcinonensis TaxID=198119 RepID=A0A2V4V1K7_PAEBA|nr:ABC transporter ATP-binding protein [Paenibacillus barcinonensis]PYE42666.1 ABC-2 type transport system ATP-binding protein [Paenibacillus barcinonensis]QKS58893.1 ABC transporter ATP-binding protein [Paenibacillus barcinonensis]
MIEVRNITKHFGTQPALMDVSFTIQQGTVTGLIGPNGSGKTTLIRIMNGVLGADHGQVMIQGMNTSQETEKVLAICGTLTEQSGLYENMSGRDNLLFFADAFGLKQPAERIKELIELLEIQDYQHRKVGTYSTGMKKRLGLARVLLHRPSILFLDEPTNGLDPDGIQMVLRIIRQLNAEQGMTILISSHVLTQLSAVCDHYIFMEKGRIVEKGTEQEIILRYQSAPRLEVEADMPNGWKTGMFSPETATAHTATFQLSSREQIPQLLRQLTERGQVYQARMEGNDLESIYFAIREANAHE